MGQAAGSEFKAQMDLGTTVPYSHILKYLPKFNITYDHFFSNF